MMILAEEVGFVEVADSLEAMYHDSGYSIGCEGSRAVIDDVFAHHSVGAIAAGRVAFTLGNFAGLKRHAEEVGYAQGLAGGPCDRPASIRRLFDRDFVAGWQRGADEWADREAILREDEAQEWAIWFEREHAERDAEARFAEAEIAEAGGWYTAALARGGSAR